MSERDAPRAPSDEIPPADPTAPEVREGRRGDPADTSLPPMAQDEEPGAGPHR